MLIIFIVSFVQAYKYYSYQEILNTFDELVQQYPDQLKKYYPLDGLDNLRSLECGDQQCQFFYVEYSNNFTELNQPVVLIAAGFHGDEKIGQNVVTELAKYLFSDHQLEFLKHRRIILYPMVNPYGYYHNTREELRIDANRDFNVDNQRSICFQTNSARGLAQVYNNYIVQLGITFHGGDNSITYSWGTTNHQISQNQATEAPDDNAMNLIAKIMKDIASSNKNLKIFEYQIGKMTNVVYPVQGGYEDWAYAAGWDKTNNCGNRNNKSEYQEPSKNARALTYLIEAGNSKQPELNTLGNDETTKNLLSNWPPLFYYNNQILEQYNDYGNINRNIFASLALIDMVKPYTIVKLIDWTTININFGGCFSVTNITLIDLTQNISLLQEISTTGIWNASNKGLEINSLSKNSTYGLIYQCDINSYSKQKSPDPKLLPQSYFVQSRINQNYSYNQQNYSIENTFVIKHIINITALLENGQQSSFYFNSDPNLNFPQMLITIPSEKYNSQNNHHSPLIMGLLIIFCFLSLALSALFYRYCQKKQHEEVMEMHTIQIEERI